MTTQDAIAASAMKNQAFLDGNADQKNGTASTPEFERTRIASRES